MAEEQLDLSGLDEIVGPTDEQLRNIAELAQRQIAAEKSVDSASASLDEAKRNLRRINENLLPEAMTEVNLESFRLRNGIEIDVKETIRASISEANRLAAHEWLQEHGHSAIIKKAIIVAFGPGDEKHMGLVVDFLDKIDLEFDSKSAINHNTLQAWVREQLREGNTVPDEISYYEQRISKVKVK